jgi:hypothetical protein
VSVAPPPPKKKSKGVPPSAAETLGMLPREGGPERDTPLNFRVTKAFRRDSKVAAAMRGLSQVELLERLFTKLDQLDA